MADRARDWLFGSFFFGGFECSQHLTVEGRRLDIIAATQHDRLAAEDYGLARSVGMRAVREAVRWPFVDRGAALDLSELPRLARLGAEAGVLQVWDLMHYGYPDDLDPFGAAFADRFAAYAGAVARTLRDATDAPLWFTPINEASYYAWAAGDAGYMAPYARGRGGELKRALARASIAACEAIWAADPSARMLNVDPLVRMHAPADRPDLQSDADAFNQRYAFEAFDLLAGRIEPELGGSPRCLGVVGLNYYAGNQWTLATPDQPSVSLEIEDRRWVPLKVMLAELGERYGAPMVIAETGASGEGRAGWLRYLTGQMAEALEAGCDLQGCCLYPLITSPDWEDPTAFFNGGLFDVEPRVDGVLERALAPGYTAALREAQERIDPANALAVAPPPLPPTPDRGTEAIRPLASVRTKDDNFAFDTLAAGEHLTLERYVLLPGKGVPPHRHADAEHLVTVLEGQAVVRLGERRVPLGPLESVLVPAQTYYVIENAGPETLVVQQVTTPKVWDARFNGPHPAEWAERES